MDSDETLRLAETASDAVAVLGKAGQFVLVQVSEPGPLPADMEMPESLEMPGSLMVLGHSCVNCGTRIHGVPRAVIVRRPTQLPETAERVWLMSRDGPSVAEPLCRAKTCASFLQDPKLPPARDGVVFDDSIYHRGAMRFLGGPVIEIPWPIREMGFFSDERSAQMRQFNKGESLFREFLEYVNDWDSLRCVGCWSSQEEIDAVHHYACLFAQETSKDSGTWMPYWFRDARLIGPSRIAYLIKGAESYQGAVMMDTLGYKTLAWVWLTPRLRRRGVFASIWRQLEHYHGNFKVLAPLSKAMQSFLSTKDPDGAHEIVTETGHS